MFIISNLIFSLAKIIDIVLTMFYWLILIRALISWVNPDPFNTIVQLLYRMTDPVLVPIRRFLPSMSIDISPIIAFLAIIFLKSFLVATLIDLSNRLRLG
jgi:YggT family protein